MLRLRMNQRGDTIIEVLIAVTVVGLAIGMAYGISTRSLKSAQQSQERLVALKLAEGQIEQLKALSYLSNNRGIFNPGVFCINASARVNNPASSIVSLNDDDLTQYSDDCIKNNLYHIAVSPNGNEFTIAVRWISLGSLGKEEVITKYRLYQQ